MISELRLQIQGATCDRQSFERVQALLPPDDKELDALIEQFLADNAINDFGFTVLAALGANRPVDARHLVRGASVLIEGWLMEIVLRMHGNVARYLLQALDTEPFEPNNTALILLLAAIWSRERGGGTFAPEIFTKARELLRMGGFEPHVMGYLMSVAIYTEDTALLEILRKQHFPNKAAKRWDASRKEADRLVKRLLYLNERPLLESLPEREGHFLAVGDTMRRATAQVGRNQPCPCGSGKKYKHCCLDKDRQRLRRSSDIAGVTREEIQAAPERVLKPGRIAISNTYELQRMDPLKLSPAQLEQYIPGLTQFRLFDRTAEAFEKVGYAGNLQSAWEKAVESAAEAGRKDIVLRLLDVRKPLGFREDQLPPKTYFLIIEDDPEKCLAFLEDKLRTALKSDDLKTLAELAQIVSSSKFPALGIALARSVAPLAAPADASRVMEHLLRARDRLNLAPFDAVTDILDTLAERADEDADASEAYREAQEKFEAKRRESRQLREELERNRKELMRFETAQVEAAPAPANAATQVTGDKSRHERKIAHLEEELNASREEENNLRRQMQQIQLENEELKAKAFANVNRAEDSEIDREEELFLPSESQGTQPVRIVDFSRDFQQRLNNVPRHVARSAVTMLGRLAGGEPAAFVGAVRLKACPSVMRHRIGIDWRLLFRLLPDRVDAVDLIPRQDLERRIKTLVTQYG